MSQIIISTHHCFKIIIVIKCIAISYFITLTCIPIILFFNLISQFYVICFFCKVIAFIWASLVVQSITNLPAMPKTQV